MEQHLITIWVTYPSGPIWTYPDEGKMRGLGEAVVDHVTAHGQSAMGKRAVIDVSFELRVGNDADDRGNLVVFVESHDLQAWQACSRLALDFISTQEQPLRWMVNDGEVEDPDRSHLRDYSSMELRLE